MTTASEQSVSISLAMADFYKQKSLSISAAGIDPLFKDSETLLTYDELLRRATQDYTGTADPATAAAVEQAHEAVAALREYEMSTRTRLDLYSNMAAEYSEEALYYEDRSKFLTSLLNQETRVPYLE